MDMIGKLVRKYIIMDLATSKQVLPPEAFRIYRTQKPVSVMVWAGVTSTGRTAWSTSVRVGLVGLSSQTRVVSGVRAE